MGVIRRYPDELLGEIRAQSRDIFAAYVELEGYGHQVKAVCPFHQDRRPSLDVNVDEGVYYCQACGAGGDVFTFLMNVAGLDFKAAVGHAAEILGITAPRRAEDAENLRRKRNERELKAAVRDWWARRCADLAGEACRRERRGRELFRIGERLKKAESDPIWDRSTEETYAAYVADSAWRGLEAIPDHESRLAAFLVDPGEENAYVQRVKLALGCTAPAAAGITGHPNLFGDPGPAAQGYPGPQPLEARAQQPGGSDRLPDRGAGPAGALRWR